MTFHLLAYSASISSANSFESLSPLSDATLTFENDAFVSSHDLSLFAAFAFCPHLTAARLSTPLLKGVARLWVRPIERNGALVSNPNLMEALEHPVRLKRQHAITAEASQDGTESETVRVLLWLTPGLDPAPAGDLRTLVASSNVAATADAWTDLSADMYWETLLPPGRWAVLGSEHVSDNAIAHRWILGEGYRPGALSQRGFGDRTHRYFYNGVLGSWGVFESNTMPRPEVLCSDADAEHTFCLHVVRVG